MLVLFYASVLLLNFIRREGSSKSEFVDFDPKKAITGEEQESLPEARVATKKQKVYGFIDLRGDLVGEILPGNAFYVYQNIGKSSRCKDGVGQLGEAAYICLRDTEVTSETPVVLPEIINFVPPSPEVAKTEEYKKSKTWPELVGKGDQPFMPSVHGLARRTRKVLHESVAAFEQGTGRKFDLPSGRTYAFLNAISTVRGWALQRFDGKVMALEDVKLYPVDRFAGRKMLEHPSPENTVPGFVYRSGAKIYSAANVKSDVIRQAKKREALDVLPESSGGFYEIPSIDGTAQKGYVRVRDIRKWIPKPPPSFAEDDEIWIDIIVSQQMLSVYKGSAQLFTTLVSTAGEGHITPSGVFNIYLKNSHSHMSAWDKTKNRYKYYLEKVPWVMYYYHSYAIHSAFWHTDYGRPRSHGCINLSLTDVKYVFDMVNPQLPAGWTSVLGSADNMGTVIRVRKKDEDVADLRSSSIKELTENRSKE